MCRIPGAAWPHQQQTPEPQPQLDDVTSIGRGSSGITGSARAGATSGFVARMIAA